MKTCSPLSAIPKYLHTNIKPIYTNANTGIVVIYIPPAVGSYKVDFFACFQLSFKVLYFILFAITSKSFTFIPIIYSYLNF